MQLEAKVQGEAKAKTRYVFAGTERVDGEHGTKICPRCGQVLFDDMDVCYGCLYDFTRDHHGETRAQKNELEHLRGRLQSVPQVSDPLDTIELDEIDDEEPEEERLPRHRKNPQHDLDSTLDLSARSSPSPEVTVLVEETPRYLVVSTSALQVRLPFERAVLNVGRDETNDVVLRDRSVSRKHVRIRRVDDVVTVEDCGATNPAKLDGRPVEGEIPMLPGQVLEVCGTLITLT